MLSNKAGVASLDVAARCQAWVRFGKQFRERESDARVSPPLPPPRWFRGPCLRTRPGAGWVSDTYLISIYIYLIVFRNKHNAVFSNSQNTVEVSGRPRRLGHPPCHTLGGGEPSGPPSTVDSVTPGRGPDESLRSECNGATGLPPSPLPRVPQVTPQDLSGVRCNSKSGHEVSA